MTALQILRQLDTDRIRREHPNLPDSAIVPRKFQDKTHNGLINCIICYIELIGGEATKVTTSGRMITKCRTEVKGSGRDVWIPGTTKTGTPDIRATLRSISLYIEAKVGKDRQRPEQAKVEQQAIRAGGKYFLAKDFRNTYEWLNSL